MLQLSAPWKAMEPTRGTRAAAGEALDAAEQSVKKAQAYGKVIVTANYYGRLQVLENMDRPQWL